jgi:hypothetical protein
MEALEFTGKIEQGTIRLPKELESYENADVRIIMLIHKPQAGQTQKEKIKDVIQQMARIKMFRQLDNPVQWQKKLRDEWA